jgi:hypothetical protein
MCGVFGSAKPCHAQLFAVLELRCLMRVLVAIAHYFNHSSGASPLPKAAALNAQIVGLHRYFGERRGSMNPDDPQGTSNSACTLDIVVLTQRDANLLEWIQIDPTAYSVEYFDGDSLMLPHEAQRIMRDRVGAYDIYAYMEDDLIVDDPAFFAKVAWFAGEFGPRAMLMPIRYEMASTGIPAKLSLSSRLSSKATVSFRRREPVLKGRWNGVEQVFRLPNNPHAGCYVLTDDQLRLWIAEPSFYDRDTSWAGPVESAGTYAPGRVFGLYMPAEPDPWFLQIEHFGAQLATRMRQGGAAFGRPLLLLLAELRSDGSDPGSIPTLLAKASAASAQPGPDASRLQAELDALKRSRTRLFKALCTALWRRGLH